MLPFLKNKKMSAVIMAKAKPEGGIDHMAEGGEVDPGLLSAAEDMMSALAMKDSKKFAEAFKAACQMCDDDSEMPGPEMDEGA